MEEISIMQVLTGTLPHSQYSFSVRELNVGEIERIRNACYAGIDSTNGLSVAVTREARMKFETSIVDIKGEKDTVSKIELLEKLGSRDYQLLQLAVSKLNSVDEAVERNFTEALAETAL